MSARSAVRAIDVRRRIALALVLAALLVFGGRLVQIQAVEGPVLAQQAQDLRTRTTTLAAPRGEILDASGEVLATSVTRYNVGVNQQLVRGFVPSDPDLAEEIDTGAAAAAALLAPLLDADRHELGARMVGESTFVYLARGLTPAEWREVSDLGIPGIEPERTTERVYPNGTTAGNVIGYVGREGHGLAGLELTMDELLTGEDGYRTVEVGFRGEVIPTGLREEVPAQPGASVHSTIDRDLQNVAQEAIDSAVSEHGGQWGALIVEEIGTGRVLALADSGAVDPGNYQAWDPEDRGSRAISTPYEPGSTGKLPTFLLALEEGVIEPETSMTVPDRYTTGNGQTFRDNDDHPTLQLTATGALQMSSNTATVQLAEAMTDADRHALFVDLGFGSRSGIELPGESSGIVHAHENWDGRTRYTTSFGQGISSTLLQNTSMVATIGNGGVYVPPRIMAGVTNPDGTYVPAEEPEGEQVVSAEATEDLLAMMEYVVMPTGTGPQGAVPGYRVAAKTGTAQIPDGAGGLEGRLGSFVGVAPAEDPQLAIGVVVFQGSGPSYGGTVAGPAFADVMGFALRDRGVPPSTEPTPELAIEVD